MLRAKWFMSLAVAGLIGLGCSLALAGSYTDKDYHSSGDKHTYKHDRVSFTGPFDYGAKAEERIAPAPAPAPAPQGKCNCFTFDASKSFDVDRQKLTVSWDFGDGQTSDQTSVTHCYDKAGDYNVTLVVKDSSGMTCDTGVTSTKVSANFPPTAVAGDDKKICLGETVAFDASASSVTGSPSYRWDFGDGSTGEGVQATHTYEKAGNYKVRLTIDDGKNTSCSVAYSAVNVAVAERPTVEIKGPEATCTGRTVGFSTSSTGGGLKYHWDFGDGTTSDSGSSVSHTYQKGGEYTVTVTADNGQGFSCSVAAVSTKIKVNSTPIADAGENLACCVGKTVEFDGIKSTDPDGDVLSYRWDFGDGSGSDEARTSHVYEKSGNYRVVLTVRDNSDSDCGVSSDSFVANVNTQPEAVISVR